MNRPVQITVVVLSIVMFACAVAQAWDNYGAIAYSESTGRWGWSNDYCSRSAAENAALNSCNSGDCQIKVWFMNSCGALAKADNEALGCSWPLVAGTRLKLWHCQRAEREDRIVEYCAGPVPQDKADLYTLHEL